jgi:hypothetical protein
MRYRDNGSMKSRAMEFGGKNCKFLIEADGLGWVLFHDVEDEIPQDVRDAIADVSRSLKDSRINVPMFLEISPE